MKNNQMKLACVTFIFTAGLANAGTPCDGFEIKIKNNLSDNLRVIKVQLVGADIQPGNINKIEKKSEVAFIVNNSESHMYGQIDFQTISLPSKEFKIRFDLRNALMRCDHDDKTGHESNGIPIDNSRSVGKVTYTIG
ncbi:MAG: hypothetical protein Q8M03_00290 [Legionella sp.]|nr:hypothetical protein [Legionella sp.]